MDALGYCRVHSRLSDMIIRGGENIYPREVEDVLFAHSAIANVAVFGLPDSEWNGLDRTAENSKANRIETMKRSRGIWTNLFGGSKKNSEENSEK